MAIIITDRFNKAYQQLSTEIQSKVKKAIQLLAENPHHPSLRTHKIQGVSYIYEGRIDQKYRFTFQLEGEDKILRNVDNHDECLKNP